MTGTGTQNDPYIVDTWEDFITATGTSSVYVKVADNMVWDMNNIAPNGISSFIFNCTELDGNNALIKNAFIKGKQVVAAFNKMKNLRIENFYLKTTETGAATLYARSGSDCSNCIFTGIIDASSAYVIDRIHENAAIHNCSFNLSFRLNNSTVNWDEKTTANNNQFNHIIMDIINTSGIASGNYPAYCNFQNSLIEVIRKPEHTVNFRTGSAKNSIIRYNEGQESELNQVIDLNGTAHEVTAAQLQDAEYLWSIGFPIGVDET